MPDDVSGCDRYAERFGRGGGRHAKQRRFERDPLRLGKLGQGLLVGQVAEQIVQRREGQLGLHLGRSGDDDAIPTRSRSSGRLFPECRLADPRGPREQQDTESLLDAFEERRDRGELAVPADDRGAHDARV